jgi:hypothetical protein
MDIYPFPTWTSIHFPHVYQPIYRTPTSLSDRYAIERELGAGGGMATVYLAHDLRHQRRVALPGKSRIALLQSGCVRSDSIGGRLQT